MKRALYAAGTALCLLLLLAAIACAAVTRMGRDGNLYARCFHAFSSTERFGVEESRYDAIGWDMGAYFSGEDRDFSYFNQREITHLSDVRQLFFLLDKGLWLLLPAALLGWLLLRQPDCKGFLLGFALSLALLGAAAAYIAWDFEGAFIQMHRLLFTNDLWLLNPNTDLLICLMPEKMFVYLAGRLAWTVIPAWLLISTLAILGRTITWNKSPCAP